MPSEPTPHRSSTLVVPLLIAVAAHAALLLIDFDQAATLFAASSQGEATATPIHIALLAPPQPKPEPNVHPDPDPKLEPALESEPAPVLDAVPIVETVREAPTPPPSPAIATPETPLMSPPRPSAATILASRDREIAHQRRPAPANPRRQQVNANTQDPLLAYYMESWRRKVERIGNLNYPEEAKRRQLAGSLLVQASVRADGSLVGVRILRSSGHAVLDQAAVRIVELSAPFAPFPPELRATTDILDITRTWQFLRNNQLVWDR